MGLRQRVERRDLQLILDHPIQMASRTGAVVAAEGARAHTALQGFLYLGHQTRKGCIGAPSVVG